MILISAASRIFPTVRLERAATGYVLSRAWCGAEGLKIPPQAHAVILDFLIIFLLWKQIRIKIHCHALISGTTDPALAKWRLGCAADRAAD